MTNSSSNQGNGDSFATQPFQESLDPVGYDNGDGPIVGGSFFTEAELVGGLTAAPPSIRCADLSKKSYNSAPEVAATPTETIQVVYDEIGTSPFYHGTLLYTNASCQQFYAGGSYANFNSQVSPTATDAVGSELAAGASQIVGSVPSDPMGNLITITGQYNPAPGATQDANLTQYGGNWFLPGNPTSTLLTGTNLSSQWQTIVNTMDGINNADIPYGVASQNSNSAWCTAASVAGIPAPNILEGLGSYDVPGCANDLSGLLPSNSSTTPVPYGGSISVTSGTDADGNTTTTVDEISPSGVDMQTLDGYGPLAAYQQFLATPVNGQTTDTVSGQGALVDQSGINIDFAAEANANVNGSDNTLSCSANDALNVHGDNNNATTAGGTINDATDDTGNTFNGADTTFNFSNGVDDAVGGSNNVVNLTANSSSALALSGTGQTVNSTGNALDVDDSSTSAAVAGGDNTINLDAKGQTLSVTGTNGAADGINGSSDSVTLGSNTQVNLNGSGNVLDLASGDSLGASGGGNTINAGADEDVYLTNTGDNFDTVNASGDASGSSTANGQSTGIYLTSDTQANITGSGDAITVSVGDSMGAYGGNNTVNAGAGEVVVLDDTGGSFDTVDASDLAGGATTSNGQGSGIYLDAKTQANVNGNGDDINLASGDSMGAYGGGNTVNAGADEFVALSDTGGDFDTVNASDMAGGATTSNDQGTGIGLGANTQANVNGNGDDISLASGDSMGAYGGGNTINAGANEFVALSDTGGDFDTVNASDLAGGATTANGQGAGIGLGANTQVDLTGSDDDIGLASGDSLGASGGGNTIDAGAGELVVVSNTGGTFDAVNASNDVGGSTTANGQGTGITLDANAQANVSGSGDTINLGASDSMGAYGGDNTVNAGTGDFVVLGDTGGSFDTVNASDDATGINLNADTQVDLTGSDDDIGLADGDSLGASGGGNTIDAGAGELVVISSTGGTFDAVNASNDVGGGTTANGQGTGITLDANAQANVTGSGDTINLGASDTIGAYGGDNTVDAGAGDFVVLGNTGGSFDTVNASDDMTGINLDADAQATIDGNGNLVSLAGSGDTVDMGSGDTGNTIDGSGATIDGSGLGSLDLDGSNDTFDGSATSLSISGQSNTIDISNATVDLSGDDNVTIDGSGDTIVGGSGDAFTVDGTDDTISATSSSVTYDGSDTGDVLSGTDDTWTDPDLDTSGVGTPGDGDGTPGDGDGTPGDGDGDPGDGDGDFAPVVKGPGTTQLSSTTKSVSTRGGLSTQAGANAKSLFAAAGQAIQINPSLGSRHSTAAVSSSVPQGESKATSGPVLNPSALQVAPTDEAVKTYLVAAPSSNPGLADGGVLETRLAAVPSSNSLQAWIETYMASAAGTAASHTPLSSSVTASALARTAALTRPMPVASGTYHGSGGSDEPSVQSLTHALASYMAGDSGGAVFHPITSAHASAEPIHLASSA